MTSSLRQLAGIILRHEPSLRFTILEVGAAPLVNMTEPFHIFVELFTGSKILAFELDTDLCERMNNRAKPGIHYYPVALGAREESRPLYETVNPICCSLYKPNEALMSYYNNMMELAALKSVSMIDTVSLDYFMRNYTIDQVDFIKIDVQGAELDVFRGGKETLKNVVGIVCEVEFIPNYIGQPLFGDVCSFLSEQGFMFHKFLGLQGRALKPVILQDNPNFPSQHIWSDAVFMRDIPTLSSLSPEQLLKMALIGLIYGSPDVTYHCLDQYDKGKGTQLGKRFIEIQ